MLLFNKNTNSTIKEPFITEAVLSKQKSEALLTIITDQDNRKA